jgi:hypothetical protein
MITTDVPENFPRPCSIVFGVSIMEVYMNPLLNPSIPE